MNTRKPVRATVLVEYDDETTATFEMVTYPDPRRPLLAMTEFVRVGAGAAHGQTSLAIALEGYVAGISGWPATEAPTLVLPDGDAA